MLRSVIGAIIGLAIAIATVWFMQWISHTVFPPPADLDVTSTEAMAAYLADAPIGGLILVLVGYIIATFDGAFVACLIARTKPVALGLAIGIIMLALTATNLIMIPHPAWFSVSAVFGIILAAWLAIWLASIIFKTPADGE